MTDWLLLAILVILVGTGYLLDRSFTILVLINNSLTALLQKENKVEVHTSCQNYREPNGQIEHFELADHSKINPK